MWGKNVACGTAALYKLQPYVNGDLLRSIYFSIVYCHLHYAVLMWGTASAISTNLVRLCVVILNNRGKRSVHQIHINEQIPIKGTQFSTYIIEIKNIYTYKLAKYICKICNQMLPKEITEEREYESNYRNFHTRQLDNKILIIRLCKSIKQQPHFVYRASKLRNAIQKDLSNRPYFYKIL